MSNFTIPIELRNDVINYFTNNKNNTSKEIAAFFGIKKQTVNTIINRYLKDKRLKQ